MQECERFAGLREALERLFRESPLGIILFDRAGRILEVNARQARNSGIPREELIGRTIPEAFRDVMQRYAFAEPYRLLVEEGQSFRVHRDQYQPQFFRKLLRFRMWAVPLGADLFAVLTEGTDSAHSLAPPEIVGGSEVMEQVFRFIEQAALVRTTVLLEGESGTGKELVARAIHARSDRARRPFLALNCGALPAPLLESTLFGSERGAFTGADRRTKGYFEAAEGGTLLLDEIGETSLELQVKLLRVLQDGVVTRLGGTEPILTDVRVLCATNRDLDEEVAARRFREDLFYRINILRLKVPALRERSEDIPLLTQHFLAELDAEHHLGRKHATTEVLDALLAYPWPGNVRELANVLEAAYVTVPGQTITEEHLPSRIRDRARLHPRGHYRPHTYREALERFKRDYLEQVLKRSRGDMKEAARVAGVNPSTLYRIGGRAPPRR